MMVLSQAYLEWEQRTIEQGLEQGKQEGERSLILRQLDRKFGTVSQDVQSSIATLSTSQLGVLGEALLDFESISDLTTWLQHLP
jgi:predicted transposase YdaD